MKPSVLNNQNGQGIMEYIILTTLVGIFCLVTIGQFGKVLQKRVEHMKTMIVKNIKIDG